MRPWITLPRLWASLLLTLLLLCGLCAVAPKQLPVVLYKLCLVTLGSLLAYWLDREMFPYGRPHEITDRILQAMAMLRRAVLVLACVLGLTLGL